MVKRSRLLYGWFKESLWFCLYLLHLPLSFLLHTSLKRGSRKEPIILALGIGANPLFYYRLSARLHRAGFTVYRFKTGTIFQEIQEHSRNLGRFLETWNIQNGILIGHGLGGLASLCLPDAPRQRIGHLVTLGTPFHGSKLFRKLRFAPALQDMETGSEFLTKNWINALLFPMFTPFCAYRNEWITPNQTSFFGQGRDLVFDLPGHWNLILDLENIATLIEILNQHHPKYLLLEAPKKEKKAAEEPVKKKVPEVSAKKQMTVTVKRGPAPEKKTKKSKRGKKKATTRR